MPLEHNPVKGRPTLFFLRRVGATKVKPTSVTVTVDAGGAEAGDKTIPVTALTAAVPKNTILDFPTMRLVVTEDAASGATEISVEPLDGARGDGLEDDLAAAAEATWDGLDTDTASDSLDFQANEQTSELTAVTHGSGSTVSVAEVEVTGIAPSIPREGLLPNDSRLLRDLLRNFKTPNAYWYGKLVIPDEAGLALATYEGFGKVIGVGHPAPAGDNIRLSYTFRPVDNDFDVAFPA